ncbi:MAG: YdcF family protein [Alphaproteobacteria bacterium]|jgi:uncharacterized SAM-binding protein YcdF (DUF218 family)|nr:YdcF family protein [Alphaproteobacteria bacterium]
MRGLFKLLLGCGLMYGLGLALFVAALPAPFTTLPPNLDGLATFTGGSGRVATTLRLIQGGFTGPVLISGIHPNSQLAEIEEVAGLTTPLSAAQRQQIMLDGATTTRENLESLQLWAATARLQQVGLITSTYHAARVRLLAWWLTPNLTLILLPVQPEDTHFRVLLREYHKLLVAPFLS